jgi:hypothetical protein
MDLRGERQMNNPLSHGTGFEDYNLCNICLNIQFLAHREHSVFRLETPVGESCKGKQWPFVVSYL